MPITDGTLYSFKYVNGHPKNTAEGLLTVTAFGVLADVATGYPLLLSELTLTTALRTAAMSALAARWMARRDSRTMALIGNGAQSEFQAIAFHHLLGIRELRLYDVDPAATAKLERNLAALKLAGTARRALRLGRRGRARRRHRHHRHRRQAQRHHPHAGDDRARHAPERRRRRLPGQDRAGGRDPGAGPMRAWSSSTSRSRASRARCSRCRPTSRSSSSPRCVAGRARGPRERREVTIFDSVGFALEDFSALRYVHRLHREERGRRATIDLVPELANPKDLFALLARGRPAPVAAPRRGAAPRRATA